MKNKLYIVKEDSKDNMELASLLSSLGGKAKVSKEREKIIKMFSQGKIDYKTACIKIEQSFK